MFHGRSWRNLSESNTSMLAISVNTFLKYFSGSNWLSLTVYTSDSAAALALAPSKVDENSQFFLPITLSLTARSALLLDNSKYPFSKMFKIFFSWPKAWFLALPNADLADAVTEAILENTRLTTGRSFFFDSSSVRHHWIWLRVFFPIQRLHRCLWLFRR